MAAQNRKSSSGSRSGAAKKSSSSGKRNTGKSNQKQTQGPDLLTVVVVLIAVVLVVVLISKYRKEKEGGEVIQPTGTVTATVAPEAPTQDVTPEAPTPTQTAGVTPDTEATPEAPTPTEEPVLSRDEAERIVRSIIQLETYSIELLDDHLMIDGAEYYSFCINDANGVGLEPMLIVEKKEGTLLCYDMSGVVANIEKFPLDRTETGNEGAKTLTPEEAKALLSGYSGERLGLAKETSVYEMTVDDWTTIADGTECYGINFFENTGGKQRFRGTFYVALDGSVVFSKDDVTGDFIKR